NVPAEMAGEQARIGVVAAARRRADDEADLPALVEVGHGVLRERRNGAQQRERNVGCAKARNAPCARDTFTDPRHPAALNAPKIRMDPRGHGATRLCPPYGS